MKLIPSGELILIRGVAGSGKSTLATTLKDFYEAVHLEADDYFRRDGEYKFDPDKLSSAHTWCQNRTLHSLNQGQTVIVANTFVYFNHIMDYIDIASATGASVVIYECRNSFGSNHAPEHITQRHRDEWQDLQPFHYDILKSVNNRASLIKQALTGCDYWKWVLPAHRWDQDSGIVMNQNRSEACHSMEEEQVLAYRAGVRVRHNDYTKGEMRDANA